MWQALYDELAGRGFTVLAIAMDQRDAARPWIEAAQPTYPCLIDQDHTVADLYDMVNVPQAVWIDEAGLIVRPPENAGASDDLRHRDKATRQLSAERLTERQRIKALYVDAVRDWVLNGSASAHVPAAETVRSRMRVPNAPISLAHAYFRLAQVLRRIGKSDEANAHFGEASRLYPDSWNIWRQAAAKDASGLAAGPEFWDRVEKLGERPYYLPIELKGMTSE